MIAIQITLDRLPHPKVRGNARGNRGQKAAIIAEERQFMVDLIIENDPSCVRYEPDMGEGPLVKARISHDYWNEKEVDYDNYLIGCKAWQDALVDVGILKDDRPSTLELGHVRYHKSKRDEEKVVITIEELS